MPRPIENLPEHIEENPPTLTGDHYTWPTVTPEELLDHLEAEATARRGGDAA